MGRGAVADYDAIIVGSGHNALVCALYLSRAGWRVLVLERNAEIGGASRTAELTRPGFKHDIAATNVNQFVASAAFREFGGDLRAVGLKILSNKASYATGFKNGGAVRIYADQERTQEDIGRVAPLDVEKWAEVAALFDRVAPHVFPLFHEELPSGPMLRRVARFFATRPKDASSVAQILRTSPRQMLDRWFRSDEVKSVFAPWAYHLDCGPDVVGGAAFAFLVAMAGYRHGASAVEGGTGRLSDAMRQTIEKFGGEVRTECEVVRIRVAGSVATAVETAQGEVITANRAIVASVTPRILFGKMISSDALPRKFFRRIEKYRYAPGTFVVHLALSEKLAWAAGENLSDFSYVHLAASVSELARTYKEAMEGLLPTRPLLIVSQPTAVDPTRAPPGRHVLRIHVRSVPSDVQSDATGEIRQRNWDQIKEAYAERILGIVEEHAPNLRSATIARHVVSPLDLERGNPNLIGGDCGSGSHHPDQNYMFRPVRGWSRYATPIGRLYMIGAATWPGSGMNAASGYLAARKLLRRA